MDLRESLNYDKSALRRLARCINMIRELSPELVTIQAAHTFLMVAAEPQIPTPNLMSKTGLTQSSCSRHIGLLSDKHHKGHSGLGLVKSRPDPYEPRRNIIELTEKGRELAAELAGVIGTTQPYPGEILKQVQSWQERNQQVVTDAEEASNLALRLVELIESEAMAAVEAKNELRVETEPPS